jgi:hypothetical protein
VQCSSVSYSDNFISISTQSHKKLQAWHFVKQKLQSGTAIWACINPYIVLYIN